MQIFSIAISVISISLLLTGCNAVYKSSSRTSIHTNISGSFIYPSYLKNVPISKPPITQAQFDKLAKLPEQTYPRICKLFGSRGTEVSSAVGAWPGTHVYAWKNSPSSYVEVTIKGGGAITGSKGVNLPEPHRGK